VAVNVLPLAVLTHTQMDNAFAAERAVWVNDIKKDIADWHEFTPALTSDQKGKSQRGVLHPTCHELLAPWNFDLKDPMYAHDARWLQRR
jgi:hypothetical protein